jgi:tetratricopeptide (TPR) repeat protein
MAWQYELRRLENQEAWDQAIELLKKAIAQNPSDLNVYISMNYLLMNLLVDENEDEDELSNFSSYEALAQKMFKESYAKFSDNAEYLFFTALTASMAESCFGIDQDKAHAMFTKAAKLEPKNILYQWGYCAYVDVDSKESQKTAVGYAQAIAKSKSPIKAMLLAKGSIGEYVLEMMEV